MEILSTTFDIKEKQNFPFIQASKNDISFTADANGLIEIIQEALIKLHGLATPEIQTAIINNSFCIQFYKASVECMVYKLTAGHSFSHGIVGETNDLVPILDPSYEQGVLSYTEFKPFTEDPYIGTPVSQFKDGLSVNLRKGRYPERWDKHVGKHHFLIQDYELVEKCGPLDLGSYLAEKVDMDALEDGVYRVEDGLLVKCDYTLTQLMS